MTAWLGFTAGWIAATLMPMARRHPSKQLREAHRRELRQLDDRTVEASMLRKV